MEVLIALRGEVGNLTMFVDVTTKYAVQAES